VAFIDYLVKTAQRNTGQTNRTFAVRYNSHIWAIKSNKTKTVHNTEQKLDIATVALEIMVKIIYKTRRANYMNKLDKFHIHRIRKQANHMSNIFTDNSNLIYSVILNSSDNDSVTKEKQSILP
jgi:ribose 5-phosphate isomerase